LGILGLSQVVYIGGKLVTPTSMADLNKSIDDLRQAEKKFRARPSPRMPVFSRPTSRPPSSPPVGGVR
jgi:hypothetical protein